MIKIDKLNPFGRLCITLGMLPSSYKESLTYEEQLLWMFNYLEKNLIPTINNNAQAVEELQALYTEIKTYVDSYFDNLDIQTEINNKLDAMAQSGQLEEIITHYIQLNSVIGFNTLNDLKNSNNLIDGSYAQTYGKNSLNDGFNHLYKIRNITSGDIVDNENIIPLTNSNTLIAEKINQIIIDVTKYGVDNNGVIDSTVLIQKLIDTNPLKTLYFPNGKYLISSPLVIKSGNETSVNLIFDENATLFTNTPIDELINIGKISSGDYDRYSKGNITTIKGGIFDATNTQRALYLTSDKKQVHLLNLNIINVKNIGIYLDRNISTTTSISTDTLMNNISITGTLNYEDNNVGLYLYGTDNEINNLRITGIKKAIDINGGGNLFNNCHLTNSYNDITTEMINNSICVNISGYGSNYFNNFYADTYGQNFIFNTDNQRTYINNLNIFYYLTDSNSKYYGFIYNARNYCRCNNCFFDVKNQGEFRVVKTTSNLEFNSRKYPTMKNLIYFKNCDATYIKNDDDWFIESSLNSKFEEKYSINNNPWTITMTQNKWYKIALINSGCHEFTIQVANDQITRVKLKAYSDLTSIICEDILHSSSHNKQYEIALGDSYTNETGDFYCYLYIRAKDTNSSLNVQLSNITKLWNSQTFMCGSTTPLDNPNIITSANLLP